MGKLDALIAEEYEHIDNLTGLQNLNGILAHLQERGEYAASDGSVIIYLNVMNFKAFNQKYGFAGGNEFLKGIASEIQSVFSEELIARTGGDQFIILAKSLEDKDIKDRLARVRESSLKYEKGLRMRIKAGIYMADGTEDDPVVMIDRAKMACDDIIRVYDRDINFYDEALSKKNELRQYVIDNFENAFKQRYFKVYYQKEVRAITGKVCGYEALARWQDPVMGIISPAIFVEVLESVHLVHKLDICIIEMVCEELRRDMDSGYCVEPISVNLSQLDFELCDIMSEIDKCRKKYNIPVDFLHIEVTESAISSGSEFLGEQIRRFRNAGYEVWIDDFVSGYSSLNNLKSYDFDVLKIDMDFLRSFENNKRSHVIIGSIVNMAKELGIHTLAEGVETQEQYEFLKRIGCEKLQGYLFGKPKPYEEFDFDKELTLETCEDFDLHTYYDSIGELNFLGNTPLRPKAMEVYNNLPIAITELENGRLNMIYANNAYLGLLSTLGLSSIEETNRFYSSSEIQEVRSFIELIERAERSPDHRASEDTITNGSVLSHKVKYLASCKGKRVFAVVSRNVSVKENSEISESLHVAMTHVLAQYFRVDLYDEDGTVENVFLNTEQQAVADYENDAVKAVSIYTDMYLFPEDRERFRKFYDMTTVRERCQKAGTDYIVDYYRSAIPQDKGRLQMYMILPFFYNNRWKYISCCRYADEISREDIRK